MAVSGGSGRKSCWDMQGDPDRVVRAIQHVAQVEGLENLPVFATGASSGGAFMGSLTYHRPSNLNLKCIAPMIMGIPEGSNNDVPTIFVHMPRDAYTAEVVKENLYDLEENGVRAEQIL